MTMIETDYLIELDHCLYPYLLHGAFNTKETIKQDAGPNQSQCVKQIFYNENIFELKG